ncbi:MAG: gluconate 2-dehydrogenase subunit 3 family protein, partial [Sandaracinaceae bacterium]|nr:gluconate 2-dehydrogenase subunit 3 family protein [Sandaracinaceae bacterium]
LALRPTRRRNAPSDSLRVLTLDEHAIVAAVASRTCPPPAPDVPGADALDVGLLADRFLTRCEPEQVADVKTALAIFESGLVGAIALERTAPFTQLEPEAQDRVLLSWSSSSILVQRTIARALTALTTSLYFGQPRVWPGVGYPGPPDHAALRRAYVDQLVDLDALIAPIEAS